MTNLMFLVIAACFNWNFHCVCDLLYLYRNLDKVLAGGSQFGANQQLFDLYQR